MNHIIRLALTSLLIVQLGMPATVFAQSRNTDVSNLQALIKQLEAQLSMLRLQSADLKLTGQIISSADVYTTSLVSKPNDLVVLRWDSAGHTDCLLSGPEHPQKSVSVVGITEVRAPQSGIHVYILSCKKDKKVITTDFKVITGNKSTTHSMEFMVKHKDATKNKFKTQDIVVPPNSKFDLQWRTKGYEGCWFSSDRYALTGKQSEYKVKTSGTSKGWVSSGPGESAIFTLKCIDSTKDGNVEDLRILQIRGLGVSDKG